MIIADSRIRSRDLWHAKEKCYHCAMALITQLEKYLRTNGYNLIINDSIAGKWVQDLRISKLAISLNSLVEIDFNYLCSIPILYRSTPHSQGLAKF